MEKANQPYHLPGPMIALLRKTALENIVRDFSLISEEYGFWEKLPEKVKAALVKVLFSEMLPEFQTFLHGCEEAFVNNFMVSLAHRIE
mmetsp:Transcript_29541/g.39293  ORF Transcript_29541/g.39293 Transcript_29541/m.39293 type:complete len:88 (-) Transcript_29541:492-755(-)